MVVAWNTRASDDVIRVLVEALGRITRHNWPILLKYADCDGEVWDDLENAEKALAQAREHLGK